MSTTPQAIAEDAYRVRNLLAVLRLRKMPTPDELKGAYRRRARETHPDSGGRAEDFAEVQNAYVVLRDSQARANWLRAYKLHYQRVGKPVCGTCLGVAERCVCSLRPRQSPPTPAQHLGDELAEQLRAFVVRTSNKLGDEVAELAASLVDRSVHALQARLTKRGK